MRSIISRKFRLAALLGAAILGCGAINLARADGFRIVIDGTFAPHPPSPFATSFYIGCAPSCAMQSSKLFGGAGFDKSAISDFSITLGRQTFTKSDLVEIDGRIAVIFDKPLRHGVWMKFVKGGQSLEISGRKGLLYVLNSGDQGSREGVAIVRVSGFRGTPGSPNCHGQSVSELASTYGGLAQAARALNYSGVDALQADIALFCGS